MRCSFDAGRALLARPVPTSAPTMIARRVRRLRSIALVAVAVAWFASVQAAASAQGSCLPPLVPCQPAPAPPAPGPAGPPVAVPDPPLDIGLTESDPRLLV